jgi:hypothetical protein
VEQESALRIRQALIANLAINKGEGVSHRFHCQFLLRFSFQSIVIFIIVVDAKAVKDINQTVMQALGIAAVVSTCVVLDVIFVVANHIVNGCFDVGFGIGFHGMYLISNGLRDIAGRSERMTQSAGERKIMTRWTWNHHKPCPVVGRTGQERKKPERPAISRNGYD